MQDLSIQLQAAGFYTKHNGISHAELTSTMFRTFEAIMADRGHAYSRAHRAAIYALCGTLTEIAQGTREGRIVWPIPTGGGKTTVALAAMLALHHLKLSDVGVVVCQSRIGSLCELRADLDRYGVPKRKVSLIHSSRSATWPSDSHDPKNARQFVLLTHANVIDRRRLWDYATWRGQPRIILWDESLLTRAPASVELRELGAAIGSLRHVATHPDHGELETALSYLATCEARAMEVLKERLVGRGTDSADSIETRLEKARWEMDQAERYDLVVVNDDLEIAFNRVVEYLRLD